MRRLEEGPGRSSASVGWTSAKRAAPQRDPTPAPPPAPPHPAAASSAPPRPPQCPARPSPCPPPPPARGAARLRAAPARRRFSAPSPNSGCRSRGRRRPRGRPRRRPAFCLFVRLLDWLVNWLVGSLIGRLADWLDGRFTGWSAAWSVYWLVHLTRQVSLSSPGLSCDQSTRPFMGASHPHQSLSTGGGATRGRPSAPSPCDHPAQRDAPHSNPRRVHVRLSLKEV